ncbi:MAG: hypothetical protein H6671_15055 [Anaerolineaceae bacterium]|nr:hypothetical protein [Anaerolineaceae bacterium]
MSTQLRTQSNLNSADKLSALSGKSLEWRRGGILAVRWIDRSLTLHFSFIDLLDTALNEAILS